MTLDGFLTFLTLIIAAYGVASSATRLHLRLHEFKIRLISIIGFFLVIYYEMFAYEGFACPAWLGRFCAYLVLDAKKFPTPSEVAFAVVILWALTAWFILTRKTIPARALPTLRRLVDELAYERRFAELIQIVEPHLPLLTRAAGRRLRGAQLYDLAKSWRPPESMIEVLRRYQSQPAAPPCLCDSWLNAVKSGLGKLGCALPDGKVIQNAADQLFRTLLLSRDIIQFVALYRAAFGVKLLESPVREVEQFAEEYLTTLVETPHSTLYSEVKNNQNYAHASQYAYPEENRLLHYLFSDARQAERLGVWKPLGEWVISRLRPTRYPDYADSLNLSADSFDEECWDDSTFIVVRFFDLMVSAAEYQDVKWHMWLFYFPHFMEGLVTIYSDDGPDVSLDEERPTRAAYIIYEMFWTMRRWIVAVTDLPATSSQVRLDQENLNHENGNIPKSAIIALGSCLSDLLLAHNVGSAFKSTICDLVFRGIDSLPLNEDRGGFRRVLIKSIIHGGVHRGPDDPRYGATLSAMFSGVDHELGRRLDDFAAALREAHPPEGRG